MHYSLLSYIKFKEFSSATYSTIHHASWHTVGLRLWKDWPHEEPALLRTAQMTPGTLGPADLHLNHMGASKWKGSGRLNSLF